MLNDRINRVLKGVGFALVLACLSFFAFGSIAKHSKAVSSDIETINRGWARISRMGELHVGPPFCPGSAGASPYHACYWYDLDGNLLSDDVWTNTWDAENRLISTGNYSGLNGWTLGRQA